MMLGLTTNCIIYFIFAGSGNRTWFLDILDQNKQLRNTSLLLLVTCLVYLGSAFGHLFLLSLQSLYMNGSNWFLIHLSLKSFLNLEAQHRWNLVVMHVDILELVLKQRRGTVPSLLEDRARNSIR